MANDVVGRMMRLVGMYDQLFREFIEKLISEYPRSTVILFGSRARVARDRPVTTMFLS